LAGQERQQANARETTRLTSIVPQNTSTRKPFLIDLKGVCILTTLSEFELIEAAKQARLLCNLATEYNHDKIRGALRHQAKADARAHLEELASDVLCTVETLCEHLREISIAAQREQRAAA
jgi:hypothetical protein